MFSLDDPYVVSSIRRFKKKVKRLTEDECWIFTGTTAVKGGYGQFYFNGKQIYANRFALMIKLKRDLKPKKFALHSCDNPPCCNPKHLREGTHWKNMSDAMLRRRMVGSINIGTFKAGSEHRNALLSENDVSIIRNSFILGTARKDLAKTFNVSRQVIDNIINGKTYA